MAFDDFAAQRQKRKRKCWTCSLPDELRTEVNGLRKRVPPVSYSEISEYLKKDHQRDIASTTLQKHFASGHAE